MQLLTREGSVIIPHQIFYISVLTHRLEKGVLTLLHQYQDSPQPVSMSLCVVEKTHRARDGLKDYA